MLSKVFLVFFLGLVLSSSIARGLPNPKVNDKCPDGTSKQSSNNLASGSKDGKGGDNKNNDKNDPQTSLTLDPKVICKGFENDGQQGAPPGQVPSLTSGNNFINFCETVDKPLTNGKQIKTGSCNPAPMGVIPGTQRMPSSKFAFPKNFDIIKANTNFTIKMKIQNLQSGSFANPDTNYYSAPQQLDQAGNIIGHTHYVVQEIKSFTATDLLDTNKFAFFKGANDPADAEGIIAVDVGGGLPEGTYRIASLATTTNHVPLLLAVAQHGHYDDMVYFSVTKDGEPAKAQTAASTDNKNKSNDTKSGDSSSCSVEQTSSNSAKGKDSKNSKST